MSQSLDEPNSLQVRPCSSVGRALDYKTNPVVAARVRVASALATFALGGDGPRSVAAAAIVVR